ncbi:hypothetical protein [Kamptonema formosum]|uniref:hypothetical protein n=1 Tax=Kamptonema formosum TaxID=331992 RepID=UPI00034CB645|nr:hypothetical protein [Oscillatoria sp. PCC 10802]
MLQENLTPCAGLLYQWIVQKVSTKNNNIIKLDLRDFQAWSAEFRDFPYSEREILKAFRELGQLELISVAKTEVTVRAKRWDSLRGNRQQQDRARMSRPVYLTSCIAVLLAALLFGGLKFAPSAADLTSLQTQWQNLKLPNPWSASHEP